MHFDPSLKKEGTDPPALALGIRNSCLVIQLCEVRGSHLMSGLAIDRYIDEHTDQ